MLQFNSLLLARHHSLFKQKKTSIPGNKSNPLSQKNIIITFIYTKKLIPSSFFFNGSTGAPLTVILLNLNLLMLKVLMHRSFPSELWAFQKRFSVLLRIIFSAIYLHIACKTWLRRCSVAIVRVSTFPWLNFNSTKRC